MKESERSFDKRKLTLVSPSSGILNQVSEPIEINQISSQEIQQLVDSMLRIASSEQGDMKRRTMVGLAAPQLGISKRIIIVDTASTGMGEIPGLCVYINPAITCKSKQLEQGREGCFSTGSVCGIVNRSNKVAVSAYNRQGEFISEVWTGFTARIFQHEIDHLDGVRFPDRITDASKLHWVEPDRFGEYRTKWAEWQELCPPERWEMIRGENNKRKKAVERLIT